MYQLLSLWLPVDRTIPPFCGSIAYKESEAEARTDFISTFNKWYNTNKTLFNCNEYDFNCDESQLTENDILKFLSNEIILKKRIHKLVKISKPEFDKKRVSEFYENKGYKIASAEGDNLTYVDTAGKYNTVKISEVIKRIESEEDSEADSGTDSGTESETGSESGTNNDGFMSYLYSKFF
jgi:hypothetical protein